MPKVRRTPSSGPTRIPSSRPAFASRRAMRSETPRRTAIELAPFEIVETTGVSSVLLEATVVDKADRFVGGLDAASFRVLENDEPQTIDLVRRRIAAGDLHAAGGREPEHARTHGVRSRGRRAARRLPPAERSHHRGAVRAVARSDYRANRRSRDDRGRRVGNLVQRRHGNCRRPHRGLAPRGRRRRPARHRADYRRIRREQPGEDGGRARGGAVGARRGIRDWRRRRRRNFAQGRARAQEDRPRDRRARVLSVAGTRSCRPCTSSSPTTCSSAT